MSAFVSKVAAMELIYQAMQSYLAGSDLAGEYPLTELLGPYRSFCQKSISGMFVEYVIEELMDRVQDSLLI